jgi:Na+-driven multidrug efflux pump
MQKSSNIPYKKEWWVIIFILGFLLINYPIIHIFNKDFLVLGYPAFFLYLMIGWFFSIVVIFIYARLSDRRRSAVDNGQQKKPQFGKRFLDSTTKTDN